ncbi:MAG: YHS domain-containing protein [Gammaproteobacteria bacterium]
MEQLLSFLFFAAVFYLMMRYGCGAHLIDGRHDRTSIDPVCGMEVKPDKGYGKMHHGREYRFCSRNCLIKFDDDPERFLNAKDTPS